uniref:Uncharacterized protein n=1 Tax=Anguilla anguilla TaxID=7936 RepID=A0A0E9UM18_ANGAN
MTALFIYNPPPISGHQNIWNILMLCK